MIIEVARSKRIPCKPRQENLLNLFAAKTLVDQRVMYLRHVLTLATKNPQIQLLSHFSTHPYRWCGKFLSQVSFDLTSHSFHGQFLACELSNLLIALIFEYGNGITAIEFSTPNRVS
jgi:hypothetical protein